MLDATEKPCSHLFRFSVEMFNEVNGSEYISDAVGLELIDGLIYEVNSTGPRHGMLTQQIGKLLMKSASDSVLIRGGAPVLFDDFSELLPDISVVRLGEYDPYYENSYPNKQDVQLIIEVSDSLSHPKDRNIKLRAYAEAMIPETWIFNTQLNQLEWFSNPVSGSAEYADQGVFKNDELVERDHFRLDLSKISF